MTEVRNTPTPSAPPPPPSQQTVGVGDISKVIRPTTALAAVQVAGIAYAITWVAAFVLLLLAKVTDSPFNPFTGAFQLVPTSAGASFRLPMGVGLHLSLLSVLAVTATASVFWVHRTRAVWADAGVGERMAAALVAGVSYAVVATGASALFPVKIGLDSLGSDATDTLSDFINLDSPSFKIHAASVSGFFILTAVISVLVAVVVALSTPARVPSNRQGSSTPTGEFLSQMKTSGLLLGRHVGVLSVLTVVALVVYDLFGDPSLSDLFAIPVLLGNVLVYGLGLGHLGGFEFSYEVNGGYGIFGGGDADSSTATIFSDGAGGWAIVGFIAVLVTFVLGAVVSVRRRPASNLRSEVGRNIAASALVWALFGAALSILGRVSIKGAAELGEAHGDVHLAAGLAAWTFLVFAVWGAAFETLRVFVAPSLVGYVPNVAFNIPGLGTVGGSTLSTDQGAVHTYEQAYGTTPGGPTTPPPPYAPGTPGGQGGQGGQGTVKQVTITKKHLAIGGGVVVVLAAGWLTQHVVNGMMFGAKHEANSVAAAFDSGDTSKIADLLRHSNGGDSKDSAFALLDQDVFDKAKPDGYKVSVKKVEVHDDSAYATLTVHTKSASWPMAVSLTKDGHRFGVFDRWKVDSLDVSTLDEDFTSLPSGISLTVNGKKVDAATLQADSGLYVLPGNYTFHADASGTYTTVPDVVFTVDGDGYHQTSGGDEDGNMFSPTLTSEGQKAVDAEVSRLMDECMSSGMEETTDGVSCPDPYWYGVDNPKFSVVSQPVLDYSYQGLDDAGNPTFEVSASTDGEIDGTGKGMFGNEDAQMDVSPQGTVTVQGDTLAYSWDSLDGYGW